MKKYKTLAPIDLTEDDFKELQAAIVRLLYLEVYKPLIEVVPGVDKKSIQNSKDDVLRAIQTGKIVFNQGKFKGAMNSRISGGLRSLGARWDRKEKVWRILLNDLPEEYQKAIKFSEERYVRQFSSFNDALGKILPEKIAEKADFSKILDRKLFKLDDKISKQLDAITVAPQLTKEEKEMLAEEYNNNLKLEIKKFTDEQVRSLRSKVERNVYSGNRYENLIDTIRRSYKVTENKAKFLARQETKLMTSKYREVRYKSAGSPGYYWKCVLGTKNHPVRPDHKILDGDFFTWDNPPIVDRRTGRRCHPGQDFNCRCRARVVMRFNEN